MRKVIVLMSTYNGECFVKEQIDSILGQKDVDIELYIRDDNSVDGTEKVLRKYCDYPNVYIEFGNNLGVGNSFMNLLYNSPKADYYAFADQDDIWLPDKLIRAVRQIELVGNSKTPILYGSNQTVTDRNGSKISMRYSVPPQFDLVSSIEHGQIAGCTMVMNSVLKEMLCRPASRPTEEFLKIKIHDAWVLSFANCIGTVIYDEESYILYRQHDRNVVGAKEKKFVDLAPEYRKVLLGKSKYRNRRKKTSLQLLESSNGYNVSDENKHILELYKNTGSIRGNFKFICSDIFSKKIKSNHIVYGIKLFLGLI